MTRDEIWEFLRSEVEHKGIFRVPPNGRNLPAKAPNKSYSWQFYLRRCLFDPKFVIGSAELLVEMLPDKNIQIGACEDAGVPLGLAMSAILGTPMISVKKTRKVYGLLNFTEGVATGKPIVLVDDLAGSQDTLKKSVNILHAFGLPTADFYVALVNKTQGTHKNNYVGAKELISLFTCDDFAMSWTEYVDKFNKKPEFGAYF
jgi:adenine/guanine phosphoribosyltransferase-like PRPP-binding protein